MEKLKPIAPIDVIMLKDKSGDICAYDNVNKRIISNGFDDEDDYNEWKKLYFKHKPK